jgi:hypothetical protein
MEMFINSFLPSLGTTLGVCGGILALLITVAVFLIAADKFLK